MNITPHEVLDAFETFLIGEIGDVEYKRNGTGLGFVLTSAHVRYQISAHMPAEGEKSYLGAIGYYKEGGNDLYDGPLTSGTLDELLWDIECYDAIGSGASVSQPGRHNRWGGA